MKEKRIDIGIIGAGVAGCQAAMYTSRRKLSTYIFGKPHDGALEHALIENVSCIETTPGNEIIETQIKKVTQAGGIFTNTDIIKIEKIGDDLFKLTDEYHNEYVATTILFATGIAHNKLGIPGEKEFLGRGVSNCVECDANFYKQKVAAIVGSGSAAVDGVSYLSKLAKTVYFVTMGEDVDTKELESIKSIDNVEIINKKPTEIQGDIKVRGLKFDDSEISLDGVFIELGAKGVIDLLGDIMVTLDDEFKHVVVDRNMETSYKAVFAAGDITGLPYQVGKAIGEGTVSGIEMGVYAAEYKKNKKDLAL